MFQNPYMKEEWYADNKMKFSDMKEHHDMVGKMDGEHMPEHMEKHHDGHVMEDHEGMHEDHDYDHHHNDKKGKKDKKHHKAENLMNDVKDVFGYDSAVYLQTTVIATVMIAASALI